MYEDRSLKLLSYTTHSVLSGPLVWSRQCPLKTESTVYILIFMHVCVCKFIYIHIYIYICPLHIVGCLATLEKKTPTPTCRASEVTRVEISILRENTCHTVAESEGGQTRFIYI